MSQNDKTPLFQPSIPLFSKEESEAMSKLRIVQKNLVHVQGFPEYILDHALLQKREYFGQYGHIKKLVLASKTDSSTKKKTHSAYITYSSSNEASLAVLSIDSIIINGHFIRAFFGTSKYCIHFLNKIPCYNKDKCLFIHYIASPKEIIGSNCNFGYTEHLTLAREISEIDNPEVRKRLLNSAVNENAFFPPIQSFISKDRNNHPAAVSTVNSKHSHRYIQTIYKYKDKSRFFDSNDTNSNSTLSPSIDNTNNNNNNDCIPDYILKLIDELFLRFSFFKKFSDNIPLEKYEIEYCKAKYQNHIEDSWYNFIFNAYE